MLCRLPVVFDWAEFKGETVFVGINYEESKRVGRPMMDIFHCATAALNHSVIKTVQWDKNKFNPSALSTSWLNSEQNVQASVATEDDSSTVDHQQNTKP